MESLTAVKCDRKWQQISAIDKVTIRNDGISTVGTITDNDTSTESDAASCVGTIASHFVEIDLQDNLIWEWKEVRADCKHLFANICKCTHTPTIHSNIHTTNNINSKETSTALQVFALGLHMPRLQSLLLHRNKLQQLTESLLNALP